MASQKTGLGSSTVLSKAVDVRLKLLTGYEPKAYLVLSLKRLIEICFW